MSKDSAISWTDNTFNPWWGCSKISAGCTNCYADAFSNRLGLKIWGQDADRRLFGEQHWREPLAWNKSAELRGARERVFCASMADVFEDRRDLDIERARLWALIESTPSLDWLLLTKRPDAALRLWPWVVPGFPTPPNVWIGATMEDQKAVDERMPFLAAIPARVRFASMEPLLSPVVVPEGLDWVIVGGESGAKRRDCGVGAILDVAAQCVSRGIPVHVKQDCSLRSGAQGRIPDSMWALKQFPRTAA